MRLIPFRAQGHTESLFQSAPAPGDMAVVRTVIGYAPAPPAVLQRTDAIVDPAATDPASIVPVSGGAPVQLAPSALPIEIFDADELLG